MEPKELQIGIIGNDNKLYIAYYNFINKSYHIVTTDEKDKFEFESYGVTKGMYNEYTEKIKNLGFVDDNQSLSHFTSSFEIT